MSSLENELNTKRDQCSSEIAFEEMTHLKFYAKDRYTIYAFMWFLLNKINICI